MSDRGIGGTVVAWPAITWSVNSAVAGLLLAALYTRVWTSAIDTRADFGIELLAFLALVFWKVPPWLVVIGGGVITAGVASLA